MAEEVNNTENTENGNVQQGTDSVGVVGAVSAELFQKAGMQIGRFKFESLRKYEYPIWFDLCLTLNQVQAYCSARNNLSVIIVAEYLLLL